MGRGQKDLLLAVFLALAWDAVGLSPQCGDPRSPHRARVALGARNGGGGERWADRRSNYAKVSAWREPAAEEAAVVYEVDRKVIIKHLPDGADARYLRDVLSDAFGPLASVEVAAGDVAYAVFKDPADAATATRTSVRVRTGGGRERTIDCERFVAAAAARARHVVSAALVSWPLTLAPFFLRGATGDGLLLGALGCVGSAGVALFYEEPRGGWED